MGDLLTVLRSKGLRMSKLWKSDGTIEPYSNAKWFTAETLTVQNIEALSTALDLLQSDPNVCIVRGAPNADIAPGQTMRRLIENVEDRPLHTILIEIDEYVPLINDPITEPQEATLEFIYEHLPTAFHDVSYHWQLSSSAGAPGKQHLLKAHLWFWLTTPYDSATLKAWAIAETLQIDRSVLNPVQCHFVASPVFEEGRTDPVPQRSGFFQGASDSVPLLIDISLLDIRAQGVRQRGETREIEDPVADWVEQNHECWGTLPNGGLVVSCPFEAEHSGGAQGDTSTVYFPSGSNGYAEGRWVCLHNACRERSQESFNAEVGYAETRLAMLASPEPLNGHALNGHAIEEDLPWFERKSGSNRIKVSMDNLQRAIQSPKAVGMDIRLDTFREEIMWAAPMTSTWHPFQDHHYVDLRIKMEQTGFEPVSRELTRDIVWWQASHNAFDTARSWLDGLTWDGVPRIDRFWIDHFGVVDDMPGYALAVGAYIWTALAGRIIQPGVQADMAPILTGPQGLKKSRGVKAMAPRPEFATTMSFHEPEVERARKMRGTLVVELAELQGLKSRDREEILAWMTRDTEHWTPKFKEMSRQFQRRFVMIATTNDDDFLDDPNGERRWLPIAVGRQPDFIQVDIAAIAAVRDQLWAEGRDRFLADGVAWRQAERLARTVHGLYKSDDLWQDAVRRWLSTPDMGGATPAERTHLTTHEVAEGALAMAAKAVRYADQRRISKILTDEGYQQKVRTVGGKPKKVWIAEGAV